MEKKDKKKKEKREREKKSQRSFQKLLLAISTTVVRVECRYKKVLKNKTISNYSADDLNAILGISPRDE